MNIQEIIESHISALHDLYKRIAEIARSMGGTASEGIAPRRRTIDVAEPRDASVPALFVEMPDAFHVEFAPPDVLRPGALFVSVRRFHHRGTKDAWMLNVMQGNWQYAQKPLSDEDIRNA